MILQQTTGFLHLQTNAHMYFPQYFGMVYIHGATLRMASKFPNGHTHAHNVKGNREKDLLELQGKIRRFRVYLERLLGITDGPAK